jgi:hypothetical protein
MSAATHIRNLTSTIATANCNIPSWLTSYGRSIDFGTEFRVVGQRHEHLELNDGEGKVFFAPATYFSLR